MVFMNVHKILVKPIHFMISAFDNFQKLKVINVIVLLVFHLERCGAPQAISSLEWI